MEGVLEREALVVLSQLSPAIADKREKYLLQVRGWVNRRITIDVARFYSQMISRARLPSPLREREPDWDPESGIGIAG